MTWAKGAAWALVGAMFVAFAAQGFIYGRADLASFFEDDAFYYLVIARKLAEHGVSTFDGVSPTNGYHPLWLALVTALHALGLPGPLPVHILQIMIDACSLVLLYRLIRPTDALSILFVATAFFFTMFHVGGRGMEADLLILTFCVLLLLLANGPAGRRAHDVGIGIAAALCIGARIDAATFVVPLLLVGDAAPRDKAWRLLAPCIAGALYVALNLALVGLPLPVSGYVKALGDLHVNTALVAQFRLLVPDGAGPLGVLHAVLTERLFWLFLLLPATAAAACLARGATRHILAAFCVGQAVFLVKLFFFSSWQVWAWYQYPLTLGLACLLLFLRDARPIWTFRQAPRVLPIVAMFGLAAYLTGAAFLVIVEDARNSTGAIGGFYSVNKRAVVEFRSVLAGARVAMGDRAGSLAFLYEGDVVQLEGLTGDRAYLDALRAGGDIAQTLCARDVRFVLAYSRDLGAYRQVDIPVMRPLLSDYRNSPFTRLRAQDEIGRVSDLALFDNRGRGEDGDNYLYAWRLSACKPG